MKRLSILLTILLAVTATSETFAQQFSVKAGFNLAKFTVDFHKMKPGFNVGAGVEFAINEMFAVEPALLLTTKGYKFSMDTWEGTVKQKYNVLYLEMPINAKAYFDLGSIKLYGLVGPYVACGLRGKTEFNDEINTFITDTEWGSGGAKKPRFDFGLNAGAGIDLGAIQAGVQYGWGLVALVDDSQHRVLSINAAYKF